MIIYKISNIINSKLYIGQTTKSLKKRWSDHCWGNKTTISKAIKKYGRENFKIEIIDIANSIEELNQLEEKYIKEFNSLSPNGYNLKQGGFNKELSNETKLKISLSKKGKHNPKLSIALKGIIPWNKGKKFGKRPYRMNPSVSKALTGKSKSKSHRKNLSIAKKEYYKNNRHIQAKWVLWIERNIIFDSASQAAKYLGCKQAHISRVCTGKRRSFKGFHFEYLNLASAALLPNPALQEQTLGNVKR